MKLHDMKRRCNIILIPRHATMHSNMYFSIIVPSVLFRARSLSVPSSVPRIIRTHRVTSAQVCAASAAPSAEGRPGVSMVSQDSSKEGAAETGCSGLHHIIGCFIM